MGTRAELLEAGRFLEAGTVRPVVDSVFPLSEARQAQEHMLSPQDVRKNHPRAVSPRTPTTYCHSRR